MDKANLNKEGNRRKFEHAIVCGGSIAGMLAARVLLNHFEKVEQVFTRSPHIQSVGKDVRKDVGRVWERVWGSVWRRGW